MEINSFDKNEARAVAKFIRMSPTKIRRVLKQIQGKTYKDALFLLEFLPYAACEPIIKVLRSAAANAKTTLGLEEEDLRIKFVSVDKGPTMKRFRPRAQGRACKILKTTSHINLILSGL